MFHPPHESQTVRFGEESPIAPMVTTKQLAALIGVPVATLNNWRSLNRGPRSFRLGRSVRYQLDDVAAWIEEQQQADGHYRSLTSSNKPSTESPSSTPRS